MAQLSFYSSLDASAPVLTGAAGSLLAVLDACLVDGYGAKTAAGWSKPIANSGNCGHYLQGAGASGFHLFINDNGPNVTSTFGEAWAAGWRTMTGIAAPVGAGVNQFPLPSQLLTTGHVVIRKASAANSTPHGWMVYADSRTMYLFIQVYDNNPLSSPFIFGDVYSLAGTADASRCIISGRYIENSLVFSGGADTTDCQVFTGGSSSHVVIQVNPDSGYWAGPLNAIVGGVPYLRKSATWSSFAYGGSFIGAPFGGSPPYCATPNADLALYLTPLRAHDGQNGAYRGRIRGIWVSPHAATNFAEGQVITGANETAGKTFRVIKHLSGSCFFIETSDTVETN